MRALLLKLWERLTTSFWLVPAVMSAMAILLALGALRLDDMTGMFEYDWLPRSPETIRTILSTIITAVISVTGVVFSITIVTLTLAASQFGPHIIQNFMRDRRTKIVLGIFVATFLYCIIIIYVMDVEYEDTLQFSLLFSLLLTVSSLAALIFFIHHMAIAIQSTHVIAAVSREMHKRIDEYLPSQSPATAAEEESLLPQWQGAVECGASRYIQVIDIDGLVETARRSDAIFKCQFRPGDFVLENETLVKTSVKVDKDTAAAVCRCFSFGHQRTGTQDPEFAIMQLVEIAVRALSPSINDPFTAVACLDQLGTAICKLADRRMPSVRRYDSDGKLRVVIDQADFEGLCNSAFNQIRQNSENKPDVIIRMIETFNRIGSMTRDPEHKKILLEHVMAISRIAVRFDEERDRRDFNRRLEKSRSIFEGPS